MVERHRIGVVRVELGRLALGVAVGAITSIAVSRMLVAHLFGLSPLDVVSITTVSAGSTVIAALAVYLPARAILRTDPADSLRTS